MPAECAPEGARVDGVEDVSTLRDVLDQLAHCPAARELARQYLCLIAAAEARSTPTAATPAIATVATTSPAASAVVPTVAAAARASGLATTSAVAAASDRHRC